MEYLGKLAESGVLGLLLALSLGANYFLYKEIKDINEKRIREALEARNILVEPLKAIQSTVSLILEGINNAKRR